MTSALFKTRLATNSLTEAMLDDRNNTSHTYEEETANRIFQNIKKHFPIMQNTFNRLQAKFPLT